MRNLAILGIVMGTLILGGSFMLASSGDMSNLIPFIQQSNAPSASTGEVEAWQAEQFVLLVGFLLFNLIGIAATLSGIFFFLNRGIETARQETATE